MSCSAVGSNVHEKVVECSLSCCARVSGKDEGGLAGMGWWELHMGGQLLLLPSGKAAKGVVSKNTSGMRDAASFAHLARTLPVPLSLAWQIRTRHNMCGSGVFGGW